MHLGHDLLLAMTVAAALLATLLLYAQHATRKTNAEGHVRHADSR